MSHYSIRQKVGKEEMEKYKKLNLFKDMPDFQDFQECNSFFLRRSCLLSIKIHSKIKCLWGVCRNIQRSLNLSLQ